MPKSFEERQSLVARRMADGSGSTCVALADADLILEKLPEGPAAGNYQPAWLEWSGDGFQAQYNL